MTEIKIDIESSRPIKEKIAVIGTGNYGLSIGKRLLHFGYEVVFGSRKPNLDYLNECLSGDFSVTNIYDAWNKSDNIVILAISAQESIYENFIDQIINGLKESKITNKSKILIEISNLIDSIDLNKIKKSNAEKLDLLFKSKLATAGLNDYKVQVIKGFNLINSYSMSSFLDNEKPDKSLFLNSDLACPIAGNDEKSKQMVLNLSSKIGLRSIDVGTLESAALKLELSNKSSFQSWKYPSLISIVFFILSFLWIFLFYYFFPKKPQKFMEYLKKFSILSFVNKTTGFVALNLLAFVYFGFVVASVYQIAYSTKYKKFPKYLDFWLKSRKQFGLWAFIFASIHAVLSILTINPQYSKSWFIKLKNSTEYGNMTLNGELNTLSGVFTYLLLCIVALTSINSIANSLNWSEWRFIQTKIGITCLILGIIHNIFMYYRIYNERVESGYDLVYLLTRVKLIAMYFPIFVLFTRLIFTYGPLSKKVERIKNGATVSK